jgi:hypothetical protein
MLKKNRQVGLKKAEVHYSEVVATFRGEHNDGAGDR